MNKKTMKVTGIGKKNNQDYNTTDITYKTERKRNVK